MCKWQPNRAAVFAWVLLVACLARGAARAAEPGAGSAYQQLQQEQAALAALDVQLVHARNERGQIESERQAGQKRLGDLQRQESQLQQDLADGQKRVEAVVRFLYENGTVSFLDVLFAATSFSDFVTRFGFVEQLVRYDVGVLRDVASKRRQLADTVTAAQRQQQALDQQAAQLDELLAHLQALEAQHQAALAGASSQLISLDQALLAGLPGLDYLLAHFRDLPWSSIQPDATQIDLLGGSVTATVNEQTLNAYFAANVPQFSGFAFHFDAAGASLVGNGVVLTGPLAVVSGLLQWRPSSLSVSGAPAPPSVMDGLLAGRDVSVQLPTVAPGLALTSVATAPGALRLTFGPP